MSGFKSRSLSLKGKPLPPSIPLIIPQTYDYDMDKNSLSKHETRTDVSMKLVDGALQLICSIDKPVAILSICGPYRTGKSYLLSRILECSDAFSLGHTMDPCTKGVWMSTIILECDDFVVIFLDTEGTDNVHSGDDGEDGICTIKQLSLVVLMSSLLIYNSLQVPEWSDLDDLSFLSDFSSSLNSTYDERNTISSCFPHFIWLIRDAALQVTDKEGKDITPTEYLKTQVLVPSHSGKRTDQDCVIDTINRLFPSIECHMLPRPSVDEKVLASITTNEDRLDKEFTRELQLFRDRILRKITIKMFSDQQCKNGLVMSKLLTHYLSLVNSDSKIALEEAYITAIEGVLLNRAQVLTEEYRCEMEQLLRGKYPIEEYSLNERDQQDSTTLIEIHEGVMKSKKSQFERELDSFLPAESTSAIRESLLSGFVDDICRFTVNEDVIKIVGGILYQFALENLSQSKQFCEDLSYKVFRDITDQIEKATMKRIPVELSEKLLLSERQYYNEAVGPAKNEVYSMKREELTKKCNDVSSIPGRPYGLSVSGTDKNRIKLQWAGIDSKYAISFYEIQYMSSATDWITLPQKCQQKWAIIEHLETSSDYIFRVRATSGSTGPGNWSDVASTKTSVSYLCQGAATVGTFLGVTIASPIIALTVMPFGGPLSVAVGLVAGPAVGTIAASKVADHYGPTGDLSNKKKHQTKSQSESSEELGSIQADDVGSEEREQESKTARH